MTLSIDRGSLPDILIRNATMINEGSSVQGDLLIKSGRIEKIADTIPVVDSYQIIEAEGLCLLPGMIDDQVHFREPGLTYKGEIATESRAAVAGGITTFMEMPNTTPPTTNADALEAKYTLAGRKSLANFAFYLGATNDNLEDIKKLDPTTACGVKVFMGASTGNMLVDDPDILEGIFSHAPILVATHCEDTPTIAQNLEAARARYGDNIPVTEHPAIRSEQACYKSTELAVELARRHGTQLHVLHLSTARELAFFEPGPMQGKQITAEACVHFLVFDETDYPTLGNLIKCNPAIKSSADREGILQGLRDGRLDILATDHAPHGLEEKSRDYMQAPAGLPLVQHAVPIILEQVHNGVFSLETAVEKMAHNPATRFQVSERGFLREGYWADLVLVDMHRPFLVTDDQLLYKCGWSPFTGRTFRSSVVTTIVSGHPTWMNEQINNAALGMRLEFNR